MHPLNKMRLQAGITIDTSLEKTKLIEARQVPLRRSELTARDQKSLTGKVAGLKNAIKHIQNAVKALDKIPATDFMGDIPHFIQELEYVLEGEGGGSGLIHLLDGFDKDQKSHLKDERKVAKVKAEEEEADVFNQQCTDMDIEDEQPLDESWWDVAVKHRDTDGFNIQADTRDEAEEKAKKRLSNMRGGKQALITSIKQNVKAASSNDARLAKQLDRMEPEVKEKMFKKADQKSRSGGSLSPLENYILQSSNYKSNKSKDDKDSDNTDKIEKTEEKDVKESHYYVDNKYTNYEDDEDKPVNVTNGSSNDEQVWDNRSEDNADDNRPNRVRDELQADDNAEKITIPADIKNQLRASIEQSRKEAKRFDSSNKDAANFHVDLADAFEDLLQKLETGSVYDFKQAQIFAQTFMGPMLHSLPTDVWKFLANGGKARSLKSYMQEV